MINGELNSDPSFVLSPLGETKKTRSKSALAVTGKKKKFTSNTTPISSILAERTLKNAFFCRNLILIDLNSSIAVYNHPCN